MHKTTSLRADPRGFRTPAPDQLLQPLEARSLLGMRVHVTNYTDAVQRIAYWARARESRYVCEARLGRRVIE